MTNTRARLENSSPRSEPLAEYQIQHQMESSFTIEHSHPLVRDFWVIGGAQMEKLATLFQGRQSNSQPHVFAGTMLSNLLQNCLASGANHPAVDNANE